VSSRHHQQLHPSSLGPEAAGAGQRRDWIFHRLADCRKQAPGQRGRPKKAAFGALRRAGCRSEGPPESPRAARRRSGRQPQVCWAGQWLPARAVDRGAQPIGWLVVFQGQKPCLALSASQQPRATAVISGADAIRRAEGWMRYWSCKVAGLDPISEIYRPGLPCPPLVPSGFLRSWAGKLALRLAHAAGTPAPGSLFEGGPGGSKTQTHSRFGIGRVRPN